MKTATVLGSHEAEHIEATWGNLAWFASAKLKNSDDLTVGRCVIKPGCCNPRHRHPDSPEVLVVLQGRIEHVADDSGRTVELGPGDTISVPTGLMHNARNIGDEDAVLFVAFPTGSRQVQGE